jgi:hypothetical protein
MNISTELKHKPVFVCENYETLTVAILFFYSSTQKVCLWVWRNGTERGKVDISAKVWRYTGEKWCSAVRRDAAAPRFGFGDTDLPLTTVFRKTAVQIQKVL